MVSATEQALRSGFTRTLCALKVPTESPALKIVTKTCTLLLAVGIAAELCPPSPLVGVSVFHTTAAFADDCNAPRAAADRAVEYYENKVRVIWVRWDNTKRRYRIRVDDGRYAWEVEVTPSCRVIEP